MEALYRWKAIFWLITLSLLGTVVFGLVGNNVSLGGQTVALAVVLFVFGVISEWRRGNPYLRAVAGADCHLFRATLLERRGRRSDAVRQLTQHLDRYPGNLQALKQRSALLQSLGRTEGALCDFDAALAPHPDPDLLNRRGALWLSIGALPEALADFEQACALRGSGPGLLAGVALIELRLLDRALEALSTPNVKETAPYFTVHRNFYRGEALRLLGRPDEARAAFEEALAGLTSEQGVHEDGGLHCLPDTLGHLGRNDEAVALLTEASLKNPDLVGVETHLLIALRRNDLRDVTGLVESMLKTRPFTVVSVFADLEFGSFLADDKLRSLFVEAHRLSEAKLARVRAARA